MKVTAIFLLCLVFLTIEVESKRKGKGGKSCKKREKELNNRLEASEARNEALQQELANEQELRRACEEKVNVDECDSLPCQNGGTCNDNYNAYTCTCAPGYTGIHCEIDIDECAKLPCQNGGTCNDDVNAYTCTCASGYTGTHCEIDIDECANLPCQNGGTCNDDVNTYTCTCAFGYDGHNCENKIDCSSRPCQNGGKCNDDVNTYTCTCASGYAGHNCDLTNQARGKITLQPSVWRNRAIQNASTAVDGCFDTIPSEGCGCATTGPGGKWWSVDLGSVFDIRHVRILNRDDCCTDVLQDFDVMVASDNIDPTQSSDKLKCARVEEAVGGGEWFEIACDPIPRGRYVSVQATRSLVLCEVEVYAK